ncbi:MAG: hypothetical protein IT373_23200 [Polyangiaceae bacterium]|nr:hypothetical protein [Polyangiaceae bacterium]
MRFRLFSVPVEVHPGFWLMCVFFGFPMLTAGKTLEFLLGIPIVFLSILVHEFGHAIAVRRYRMEPTVTLYMLGGLTAWRPGAVRVSRPGRVLISFAGPGAGFVLAGILFAIKYLAPEAWGSMPGLARFAAEYLLWINWVWGLFNLIPVLPFDGGHILEHVLGPKRMRTTAVVSLVCGLGIAGYFLIAEQSMWIPFLVGMGAVQSYQRFRAEADGAAHASPARREPTAPPLPAELAGQIAAAKKALADDEHEHAIAIAELLLSSELPDQARTQALEVVAWAQLLRDRLPEARRAVAELERIGPVDAALAASLLRAQGDVDAARKVLEAARAKGDERKEVVGLLIQVLIARGEVARAAAIAYDIVDSLSDDDTRHMARVAFDAGAYEWASRLNEAMFTRSGRPDDAYEAARSRALEGDDTAALALLRRAVAAGFTDTARAWSDAALEGLRAAGELDALLPRADAGS